MDFGTSFSKVNRYYEEFLKPRSADGLLDEVISEVDRAGRTTGEV